MQQISSPGGTWRVCPCLGQAGETEEKAQSSSREKQRQHQALRLDKKEGAGGQLRVTQAKIPPATRSGAVCRSVPPEGEVPGCSSTSSLAVRCHMPSCRLWCRRQDSCLGRIQPPPAPLTVSEGERGRQELFEGHASRTSLHRGAETPGSLPTGKCREPWRKLPEKCSNGHSAPQAPSQQLLPREAPALPVGSVIPSSCRTTAAEARLVPCHACHPHAAASGAQRG